MPNNSELLAMPEEIYKTQVVDSPKFGGLAYPPVPHESGAAARGYALEVSKRRCGEVRLLGRFDEVLETLTTE